MIASPLTNRDLKTQLEKLSEDQLNARAIIYDESNDEFFHIHKAESDDIFYHDEERFYMSGGRIKIQVRKNQND